jgi:uncharacterized membrane protein YjjP (DUF1212 family)
MANGHDAAIAFVLRLGRALHTHGYPAPDLEDALGAASRRLGLVGQFFSTPTSLFAAFGEDRGQRTYLSRVEPGDVNLGRLADLDAVAREVCSERLSPAEGSARVEAILARPAPFRRLARTLAYGVASAAACRLLGGGAAEVALAAVLGVVTGLLALVTRKKAGGSGLFELTAAAVVSALAYAAGGIGLKVAAPLATLGGLIVLLPGFSLTIAMAELAARHLASGTARMAGAFMVFIGITFGVAAGREISETLVGISPQAVPAAFAGWTLYVAVIVIALSFMVLLRAQPRDAPWILLSSVIGYAGASLGGALIGGQLGAFPGALAVGLASSAYERVLQRPALVPLVPGVLLLVPGSIGFRSFALLLDQQVVIGVDAAFTMLMTATSLVAGLLLAEIVFPPRRRR